MRYLGGKARQGGKIVGAIRREVGDPSIWVEPFSGGLGSGSAAMRALPKSKFLFNDNNPALQNMWIALADGWDPPSRYITREDYNMFKEKQDPLDPMTAFVGFGYSFGGKWFAGFAAPNNTSGGRDLGPYGGTMRKANLLRNRDVSFTTGNWDEVVYPVNSVVYFDPPYLGKTKQHSGVSYVDPRAIEGKATGSGLPCFASEFGEVFVGRVVVDLGNTDMLVNGGEKKNKNELLVRIS